MQPALEAAYAKRDRAREHLETLETEIDQFFQRYPYNVSVDLDADGRWYVARLHVVEEPPVRLSVLVGEIAYECLSALNHLVWELAVRKMGRHRVLKLKRSVQFPVCRSPGHFAKQGLVKDRLVSAPALAQLERLQPYTAPRYRSHLRPNVSLEVIKAIADSDKHRVLARGYGEPHVEDIEWEWDETRASGPVAQDLTHPGAVQAVDGAEFARIRFMSGHLHAAVNVDRQPGADIIFFTGDMLVRAVNMQAAVIWLTDLAIPSLAALFPER